MKTLQRFERAHKARAVEEMRACLDDDAVIESVASGGRALRADETIEALREALDDSFYLISHWHYERYSDNLVIVTTAVRHRSSNGGFSNYVLHGATVGRNGLIFRVKLFTARSDALKFLESYAARAGRGCPGDA